MKKLPARRSHPVGRYLVIISYLIFLINQRTIILFRYEFLNYIILIQFPFLIPTFLSAHLKVNIKIVSLAERGV